ncbi:hypothetical protein [Promicromonospora sp. NPDC060271]|uniref:hypothetical protein n=1 Tax=Promicromonospora sp. NPDC060271 TaxID=3347089 RepID=UPI00364861DD
MSGTDIPYGTGAGSQRTWEPGREAGGVGTEQAGTEPTGTEQTGTEQTGTETAGVKERAGAAASQLGEAGRETVRDAKERARDVAHEAGDRTRGLLDRTRNELGSQVASQQQHLAGGLRALGDELTQMSSGTQDPGYATDLVQRAGDATGHVAQWFEDREPGDVLHEVEDFARRRPGLFILMAAGAGLLVGRFLRGAKDAPSGDASGAEASGGEAYSGVATGSAGAAAGYDVGSSPATSVSEPPPAFASPAADGVQPQTTRPQTLGGERDVEFP